MGLLANKLFYLLFFRREQNILQPDLYIRRSPPQGG